MFARTIALLVVTPVVAALFLTKASAQSAAPERGGDLQTTINGAVVSLPLQRSDFSVNVQGDLAEVTVVQTFENPTSQALNATYLFPLSEDATVHAMTMQVGKETITAQIREKEKARQEYDKARVEGRAAALLTQHRPNMFTQEVANLMPGMPVKVTLTYAQAVPRVDAAYELVLPLVVGPRYNPAVRSAPALEAVKADKIDTPPVPQATKSGGWVIGPPPAYPTEIFGLTLPDQIAPDRVSIAVNLNAGLAIANVTSATHALETTGTGLHRDIKLRAGRVIDNRDFVLRYTLAGNAVQAGATTHTDARGGYFSLVVEPPKAPTGNQIASREIVFVLDTSGSMDGEPIEASKVFMREALRTLRPGDFFRIVQFNSTPREYSAGPVPATPERIADAQRFVASLDATGGTEVVPAIRQAFSIPQQPNTLRLVVFLSDGYIGNEAEVLADMGRQIGQARVYAFGVGSSVNRYLLSEMARRGRGIARYIDPTEKAGDAAIELAHRLEAPVLTDITIDWDNLKPADVTPAILPDLFAGDSLRVMGRFSGARQANIIVHGKVDGRPASLPVQISLSDNASANGAMSSAIPIIWARSQVNDLMRDVTSQPELRTLKVSDDDLQKRVTQIGLDYSIVTQWTSFIAVSNAVVNANGAAKDANVPLPMPAGVGPNAYGEIDPGAGPTFAGSSAPEPGMLALLALLLTVALFSMKRVARAKH